MALYDIDCPVHGIVVEVYLSREDRDERGYRCPDCDTESKRAHLYPQATGLSDTHPFTIGHVGKQFTSSKQLRDYENSEKGLRVLTTSDREWQNHYQHARDKADKYAKMKGFHDVDDLRKRGGKEKRRKAGLKNGTADKKIMVG